MQVLDRYQTMLHEAGNEAHDEEFEYVRQILASQIFHQFLSGEKHGNESEISRASQDLLSTDLSTEAVVSELTNSEIQRRRMARRKSLRLLRDAVMPTTPHSPAPRKLHSSSRSSETSSSVSTSSPSKHAHAKSRSGPEPVRVSVQPEPKPLPPHSPGNQHTHDDGKERKTAFSKLTNGTDIDTPLDGLGDTSSPSSPSKAFDDPSILSPRVRNLSNSTNTLIERLSPTYDSPQKGYPISNGHVTAESHPNVHGLGLNRPEMDKDLFSMPLNMFDPNLVPEWDRRDQYVTQTADNPLPPPTTPLSHVSPRPHLHYAPSPSSHVSQPPLLTKSSTQQQRVTTATRHPLPAPPPYNHHHIPTTHQRSKSFEEILNSPEFDPLNFHRTPIPQSVMTPQENIRNPNGGQIRGNHFQLILEKGSEGLGFLVTNCEGGKGGLVVQSLSPGGLAEW